MYNIQDGAYIYNVHNMTLYMCSMRDGANIHVHVQMYIMYMYVLYSDIIDLCCTCTCILADILNSWLCGGQFDPAEQV